MSASVEQLLDVSKDTLNHSLYRSGYSQNGNSSASLRKLFSVNEFLTNQLDPSKLEEYTTLLTEFEQSSAESGKFRNAEQAGLRIEDLKQQGIEYNKIVKEEECKRERETLVGVCTHQLRDFNAMWDQAIQEHYEEMKIAENEMIKAQEQELTNLDEEISATVIPKAKFSKEVLNLQNVIPKMINAKRYREAEVLIKKVKMLQKKQSEKWAVQYEEKFDRKRQILIERQKVDFQAFQGKLENSLQEKLRVRAKEFRTLLQKFQNHKNSLELQQAQELSQLNMLSRKVKNIWDIPSIRPQSAKISRVSQIIESSRIMEESVTEDKKDFVESD